jgi:hypothetical protein
MVEAQANSRNSFPLFLKIVLSVLVSLLLVAVGALGFWFFQQNFELKKKTSASPAPSPTPVSSPSVQPEESLVPVSSPEEEPGEETVPQTKSDLELLKEAFAAKYSHPVSETEVTISSQTGPYASGGIHFAGQMGGGWFLAYKQADGTWIIVADGNGTVPCEAIEPYNFPVAMVPECWDDSTSTLITR